MNSATLLLCHRLPFPPNKGDKIRSFALLKHLAARGPVHLACFIDDLEDLRYCDDVRRLAGGRCLFVPIGIVDRWWSPVHALLSCQPITTALFSSRVLSRWVKDIYATEKLGNTVIFGSAMAPYVLGDDAHGRCALFDMVDVDSDKWRQYEASSGALLRWVYAREANAIFRLERKSAEAFGQTLLVSPFEAETFRQMVPEFANKIASMNNGVDLAYFFPGVFESPFPVGEQAIVMTGRMDYRPNVDGALWFAQQVAPLVFAQLPHTHVYFVGSNPKSALRQLDGSKITVTGAVDDVRPYIGSSAAVVAPLLIARGVQNKVLEAMAMKKPVVATHQATRALNVESGVHLWIENDPVRFAFAVVNAIQNPARHDVAENARKYVEQYHDWKQIFGALDDVLDRLARCTGPSNQAVAHLQGSKPSLFGADITGANA